MCFVSCSVYCTANENQLGTDLEESNTMAIHFSRNLEMVCYTAWHLSQKLLYKHFRMFGCQSEKSADDLKRDG